MSQPLRLPPSWLYQVAFAVTAVVEVVEVVGMKLPRGDVY